MGCSVNFPGLSGLSSRLPTTIADVQHELETILLGWPAPPCPLGGAPCIDPIFGPTIPAFYFSDRSGEFMGARVILGVFFSDPSPPNFIDVAESGFVRAVRGEVHVTTTTSTSTTSTTVFIDTGQADRKDYPGKLT